MNTTSKGLLRAGQAAVLIAAAVGAAPATAATLYSTGFEPPTFTTGQLAGQDGWQEVPGASAAVQVENAFALTGTQAFDVVPALASTQDGGFRTVATTASIVTQSADIWLSSSSTETKYQFAATGPFLVGFAGGIDILPTDPVNNTIQAISGSFPVIGTFARDRWNHVDMTLNYATQTFAVALNGTTLASGLAFCGSNNGCTGAVVANYADGVFDAFHTPNVNDIGFLDNYSVTSLDVPEPASILVLGIGLAGLCVGRRRRA